VLAPGLTIEDAAASRSTLTAMLISLLVGGMLLVPSLVLLFTLFQRPPRADGGAGRRILVPLAAGPAERAGPRRSPGPAAVAVGFLVGSLWRRRTRSSRLR
jgi:cytochrome d ubiquinol oxidase subunit II